MSNPPTIFRNHFALSKQTYEKGVLTGIYNTKATPLKLREVHENKFEVFMGCISLVDPALHWDQHTKIRDKEAVRQKLEDPNTRLFLLIDGHSVGFAVSKPPEQDIKQRFFNAANDNDVIEFDYLAMFEGEEGKGRGKKYFELLFQDAFKDHDIIYWSQHSTNAPTLELFYKDKMKMDHLAKDEIPDFRVG